MKRYCVIRNERGYIKSVLSIALLIFIVYAGLQFGMPYYRHSAFKTDAKELARISIGDPEKTRVQIFERAQELKLPLEEKDIVVTKSTRGTRVQASWSETVDILGIYQKTFDFTVDVEE